MTLKNLGNHKIRIINAYGPQEDDEIQDVLGFWQEIEGEVIRAKDENCYILIQMDANAKVGKNIIKEDQHSISSNGRIMLDFIERQCLIISNSMDICKGVVTREREFENRVEKSTIDYIITCEELSEFITEMMIDEDRIHTLSRFIKKKTGNRIIKSDHNILLANFSVTFNRMPRQIRKEHFMFKCVESKKLFLEETNTTKLLSSSFKQADDFPQCTHKFFKNLDSIFHKCFKKVRIRSGHKKSQGDTSIQEKLNDKTAMNVLLLNNKGKTTEEIAKTKLEDIENKLIEETANKNAKIVREHLEQIETQEGTFLNLGFWKLKQKLRPGSKDPPMAKNDKFGNLVTSP